jgi:hypothetical protein
LTAVFTACGLAALTCTRIVWTEMFTTAELPAG